jgi:hypothetical protein
VKQISCAALVLGAFLAGCGKDIQTKEAVKKGVVEYLTKRQGQTGLNMDSMNVEVSSVTFRKDEAQATVSFAPKQGGGGGMSMSYTLERKGDHWEVKGRSAAPGNVHGGGDLIPGAGAPSGGAALPPDHPPVTPGTKKP